MPVVTEPTQIYLRTATLGDLLLENVEAINETNTYDYTPRRTPISKQIWLEGSGVALPTPLLITYRIREATMTLAKAELERLFEADNDGITNVIWIDRWRPVYGITGDVMTDDRTLLGYTVRFNIAASDEDWANFGGSINAWTGS